MSNQVTEMERPTDKRVMHYIQLSAEIATNHKIPKGFAYRGQYDFVLQHAKFYSPQELTREEKNIVKDAIKNLGFVPQMKQCFYNAQMLACVDMLGKIKYCEGFANSIIPVNHAWCTINDKVIDLTWRDKKGKNYLGNFPPEISYFGFTLPTEKIREKMLKTSWACSYLDDWKNDWELFKKPFK